MSRFNYQRSLVNLAQCTDIDSMRQAIAEVYTILEDAGIGSKPRDTTEATTVSSGNYTFPTSEPPRAWVRFTLDGAFSGGVASAHVIDASAAALATNEPILVTDALGKYAAAVSGDDGYAVVMPDTSGTMRNEVIVMHGVGSPVGTDNYTVKLDAGDTAEYMPDKFRDLFGVVGVPAYNAATDALVYFTKVEGAQPPADRIYAYAATGAVAQADIYVKTNSSDAVATYLEDKLHGSGGSGYNSSVHSTVEWSTETGAAGSILMRGYTAKNTESGRTRVSAGDSLAYLDTQFDDTTARPGSGYTTVSCDGSNGTTLKLWFTTPVDNNDKVKVKSSDTADYLENQFQDWTATDPLYSSSVNSLVYFNTHNAAEAAPLPALRGFIKDPCVTIKITGTLPPRINNAPGRIAAPESPAVGTAELVRLSGSEYVSEVPANYVTLYNNSTDGVVGTVGTPIYLPAMKYYSGYLAFTLELEGLAGYNVNYDQSIGHDSGEDNEWQTDGDCD